MSGRRISRRILLSLLGVASVPALYVGYKGVTIALRCASVSAAGDALAAIGERYLANVPEEADQGVLLAALGTDDRAIRHALDAGDMQGALAAARQATSRGGAAVTCDGWVLGRAEARCAALVTLYRRAG
ncbi:MAG: hypothetical protein AAFR84_22650 [Pseudomonadota bacterium]